MSPSAPLPATIALSPLAAWLSMLGDGTLARLVETAMASSLGGHIGIAIATAASVGLSGLMQVPYVFDPAIDLLAFSLSAAICVIFGNFPARRTARLDRIEALRHE